MSTEVKAYKVINSLLDEASFVEIGTLSKASNVITGYGTVDSRLVYVISQCGTVNLLHAKKIVSTYKMALRMGAPVVIFLNSLGMSLEEGSEILEAYGEIFEISTQASGVIPQIAVIDGDCLGTAVYIASVCDFIFMNNKAHIMLSSPNTLKGVEGRLATPDSFGSAESLMKENGLISFSYCNVSTGISELREFLSFLPSNYLDVAPDSPADDLNRLIGNIHKDSPARDILATIVDQNIFFELRKEFAKDVITGFGKMGGQSVGFLFSEGALSTQGIKKMISLIEFCDAYHIPIVLFDRTQGYERIVKQQMDMIGYGSKLVKAFATATVPKICITTGEVLASISLLLNSKAIGADVHYIWNDADILLIKKMSVKNHLLERGIIDDILEIPETRKMIIASLQMLSSKHKKRI